MTDKAQILIVDDEPDIRELIRDILEDENYHVSVASNGQEALDAFDNDMPELVLLDIWMPDTDGITLLKQFKQQNNGVTIIMMSGHGTIETAVEATRLGASDFIEKPLSTAKLLRSVEVAMENRARQQARKQELSLVPVGKSQAISLLREHSERMAQHNMPILLAGEGGTGKLCFAHYLHQLGQFSDRAFIELSPESFPVDALKLTAIAEGHCIYLYDLTELSIEAQSLLLHLLQNQKLTNCQLICSTRHSLKKAINQNEFLESLFFALSSFTLTIPPLRDHVEDIPELVHHFVDLQTNHAGLPFRRFTVAAQNRLRNHSWPGNVMELKSVIQRLLLLGKTDQIDDVDVDLSLLSEKETWEKETDTIDFKLPLREAREQFERQYLLFKLQETKGNVGQAAKLAGMERTHLYRKMRSLGIDSKQL